jgi:RNA recognition motif-containing protein
MKKYITFAPDLSIEFYRLVFYAIEPFLIFSLLYIIKINFNKKKKMNIYVSNLNYGTSDADLKKLFEEYGEVSSAKVIIDKYSGKSRGFGFVEMPNDDEAKNAINELNDVEFDGKVIVVNVAKPRTERSDNNNRNHNNYNSSNRGGYNSSRRYSRE